MFENETPELQSDKPYVNQVVPGKLYGHRSATASPSAGAYRVKVLEQPARPAHLADCPQAILVEFDHEDEKTKTMTKRQGWISQRAIYEV